jgi:hypothetical protein
VIARVNGSAINADEYADRTERTSSIFQGTDAGGTALISMLRERLTSQLAARKNASPSDEEVRRYASYIRRTVPEVEDQIRQGRVAENDLITKARFNMEEFGIGTEGAKVSDKELQDEYKAHEKDLEFPEIWTIRTVRLPNPQQAAMVLPALQRTGDFKAAARALGLTPIEAAASGAETSIVAKNAQPSIHQALDRLGPGQFAPGPVALEVRNPQFPGATQTIYFLMQLVRKTPARPMTLEDARTALQQNILIRTNPAWEVHKNQEMAEFTGKADLQIYNKRYQNLVRNFMQTQAASYAATAPGGTLSPPVTPSPAPGSGTPGAGANAPSGGK